MPVFTTALRARPRLPGVQHFENQATRHRWLLAASAVGAAALLAKPAVSSSRRLRRRILQRNGELTKR